MASQQGSGLNNRPVTRSVSAAVAAAAAQNVDNLSEDAFSDNEPGVSFDNNDPPPVNNLNSNQPDINVEIARAADGIRLIEEHRRSSSQGSHIESVTIEQVQHLIEANMVQQTERMTAMFNRVLVDQLSAFRTPPSNLGIPINPNPSRQNLQIPRFENIEYGDHIPRPTQLFSNQNNTEIRFNSLHPRPTQLFENHPTNPENRENRSNTKAGNHSAPSNSISGRTERNSNQMVNQNQFPNRSVATSPVNFDNTHSPQNVTNNCSQQTNYNEPTNFQGHEFPRYYPYILKNGLHSWDLKYDGSTGIERFIAKVDILRKANHLSWEIVVSHFHCLIKSPADRWYWNWVYSKQRDNVTITWPMLHDALINHFGSVETDEDISRLLDDKRQKPNESFYDYFEDFMTIHERMKTRKSEQTLISIIKRNLSNKLFAVAYGIQADNLESFRLKILNLERDIDRRYSNYHSSFVPKSNNFKKVNEICHSNEIQIDDEEKDQICVDEIRTTNYKNNNKFKQYFNENKDKNNKEKSIYCYKCGTLGTIFPNCPICHKQENEVESGRPINSHSE